MYKVFINERELIFSEIPIKGCKNLKFDSESVFDIAVDQLLNTSNERINIFHHNLDKLWKRFSNHYKYLEAAGGIVSNEKKEYIFIKRYNKWDLPKGKVEQGESLIETAKREIEEECGIVDLIEKQFITTTYHIYYDNQYILKATHWFDFFTDKKQNLKPQLEEGIQEVVWKNDEMRKIALENTYKNIIYLFEKYNELHS